MSYTISSADEVTDRPALNALLVEYYGVVLKKLVRAGGPDGYTPDNVLASFWPNLHKVLPPTGRLILVHDGAGRLVGCGTLQQVRPEAGELKRLYVRPEAAGHGLGRKIVDLRIAAAREMGWNTLLVNAVRGNQDMLRIYENIGFHYIDGYPEFSDPVEAGPYFFYMQCDLS
jgi:GNAT superfamily N-acetyltransferase